MGWQLTRAQRVFNAEVGRRVRALRERRGISQVTLARRAKVGESTLCTMEKGGGVALGTAVRVCGGLGVPLARILPG